MTVSARASVLLVEPDPGTAAFIKPRLEEARYAVTVVHDTGEMLGALGTLTVDIVIFDARCSETGAGEDALGHLRGVKANLPAILLLPSLEEPLLIRALKVGYAACGPLNAGYVEYLPDAVARALEATNGRRDADEAWLHVTQMIEHTGDAVLLVDAGSSIVTFNRAAEQLLACDGADALSSTLDRFGIDISKVAPGKRVNIRAKTFQGQPIDIEASFVETSSEGRPYRLVLARRAAAVTSPGTTGPATLDEQDTGRARARLRALLETARALADSKSVHVGIPRVLKVMGEHLGFELGGVWWMDHASSTLIFGNGWTSNRFQTSKFKKTFQGMIFDNQGGMIGALCQSLQAQAIEDLTDRAHLPCSAAAVAENVKFALGFPIACDGELRGIGLFLGVKAAPDLVELVDVMGAVGTFLGEFLKRKDDAESLKRSQSQLLQSQKIDLLGQLAGGMAHNFNNHLNVIAGYCEYMLKDIGADTPLAKQVDKIQLASQRAARLTKQLLAFSRKESFAPRRTDLNDVILQMEAMLVRLISEDVKIETDVSQGHLSILADPTQVGQILVNLVVNSRDAMPRGGTVKITSGPETLDSGALGAFGIIPPGEYAVLTVIDNGQGMDEQTRQRVFEPFFSTKEAGTASGLGLSTVYGIVKAGDGHVQIDSVPGKGTTVRIYFPRLHDSPEHAPQKLAFEPGEGTILVVDDEKDLLEMVSSVLTENGYTVISSNDPAKALELVKQHEGRIHVAVLDCVMPGMSGFQLARELAKIRPDMRVIHVTGYTSHPSFKQGSAPTTFAMLEKPFSTAALLHRIREVFERFGMR